MLSGGQGEEPDDAACVIFWYFVSLAFLELFCDELRSENPRMLVSDSSSSSSLSMLVMI